MLFLKIQYSQIEYQTHIPHFSSQRSQITNCNSTLFDLYRSGPKVITFLCSNEHEISTAYKSKVEGKDQESLQSSTTPDPGHHMGN